jgi:poly [ADP-ribose] polymerase 10/14/15
MLIDSARDASYSSHKAYSAPDNKGIQRMFLCRVAVGDWCKGKEGQLTPDPKPHSNQLELFDSTVDNDKNPSIFVVYHDAQAYPEYLVSFVSA